MSSFFNKRAITRKQPGAQFQGTLASTLHTEEALLIAQGMAEAPKEKHKSMSPLFTKAGQSGKSWASELWFSQHNRFKSLWDLFGPLLGVDFKILLSEPSSPNICLGLLWAFPDHSLVSCLAYALCFIPILLPDFYIILMHFDSLTLAMPPCYGSTCKDLEWEAKTTDATARPSLSWVPNWQIRRPNIVSTLLSPNHIWTHIE